MRRPNHRRMISSRKLQKSLIYLVPGEGIEPPTFGLQNRCSTAELARLTGRLLHTGNFFAPFFAHRSVLLSLAFPLPGAGLASPPLWQSATVKFV